MNRICGTILNVAATALLALSATAAFAHCDTESGPVAEDARKALESNDFTTVAIWVGEEQTDELRKSFEMAQPVYKMGGKARDLAQRHFEETAVRLHREAEGFPYTGLLPAQPLPPDVATAEKALDSGKVEPVSKMLTGELNTKLDALFKEVTQAAKHKDESLEAGRKWADAYVKYITYVHGLYGTIQEGPEHGVGDEHAM